MAEPDDTGLFDADWYRNRYPDIEAAGVDPFGHFIAYGEAEGRDPNRWFDSAWYRDRYADVADSGLTPFAHYRRIGAAALRDPHPRFNAAWYAAQHPEATADPLLHHCRVGEALGWATEPAVTAGRIGIGIVTFNRMAMLRDTIQAVRDHTRHEQVEFVVADDGSTDDTLAMLRATDVPVVTGPNRGVAWNKNRALYLLAQVRRCEVVILLEDDTAPAQPGWEAAWIEAALRWGHVNFAGGWLRSHFRSGQGTPDDPFMADAITAQCAAYAREALDWGGYFDPRFRGFGHEHVEHTVRLIRAGYGGTNRMVDGARQLRFALIEGGVTARTAVSHENPEQLARNAVVGREAMADRSYRAPWRDEQEREQFRTEIKTAIAARPRGFALSGRTIVLPPPFEGGGQGEGAPHGEAPTPQANSHRPPPPTPSLKGRGSSCSPCP